MCNVLAPNPGLDHNNYQYAQARIELENAQARIAEWERWYAGLVEDFEGVTDCPKDPQRTHTWEWFLTHRPPPGKR